MCHIQCHVNQLLPSALTRLMRYVKEKCFFLSLPSDWWERVSLCIGGRVICSVLIISKTFCPHTVNQSLVDGVPVLTFIRSLITSHAAFH